MKVTNLFMVTVACVAGAAAAANADEPLRMFLDDHHIHQSTGVTRQLQQPVKRPDPILTGNGAWDTSPYTFGTVIYDEDPGHFKMWYQTFNMGQPVPTRSYVLYATSDNGIDWHRPNLGLHEAGGSTDNNIILRNLGHGDIYSPSVIKDANPSSPDQKYKMIFWDKSGPETYGDGGLFTAFSPDGINWERQQNTPLLHAAQQENAISDVMDVMYDSASGKYVAYTKGWADPFPDHRQIVRIESEDFVNWSEPEVVITHDRSAQDPQSYGMPVFEYEGLYLGLMRSYKQPGDASIDIQLKVSRDNHTWENVAGHDTFIPTGESGEWDAGMIFTAPPIKHDGELLIYYGAWDNHHNTTNRTANMGLATLPLGRLAAMAAEDEQGTIITTSFELEHGQIELNANAKGGSIRVAILDENLEAFAGFSLDEAHLIEGDVFDHVLTWTDANLSQLKGESIHLYFEITGDAELYGFRPSSIPLLAPEAVETNASDPGLTYFDGRVIVYYTGSNQQVGGDLQWATFAGTKHEMFERFFEGVVMLSADTMPPEHAGDWAPVLIAPTTVVAGASASSFDRREVRPSAAQLSYQNDQLGAFVHFGPATYINSDMHSTPDPSIFNPVDLDAEQWVLAAKSFGAKHIVLTAKHHNGLCLWPTETSEYSVKHSP